MSSLKENLLFIHIFYFFIFLLGEPNKIYGNSVAFLGDSITTGAVSHPGLGFNKLKLLDIFSARSPLTHPDGFDLSLNEFRLEKPDFQNRPNRVGPNIRDFESPVAWVFKNFMHILSKLYLDVEEFSWSFFASKELDYTGDNIIIAAEDGARSVDARSQVRRLFSLPKNNFPKKVFIFFTGNDLCGPDQLYYTSKEQYKKGIESALNLLEDLVEIKRESKIDIYLIDPINILQLVHSPSIRNKKIIAGGKNIQCKNIQTLEYQAPVEDISKAKRSEEQYILSLSTLPSSPAEYCSGLFSSGKKGEENRIHISNLISDYRNSLEEIKKNNNYKNLKIHHLVSTSKLLLDGEDIANDCFHLSYHGQMKLARLLLDEMNTGINK